MRLLLRLYVCMYVCIVCGSLVCPSSFVESCVACAAVGSVRSVRQPVCESGCDMRVFPVTPA